MSYQPEKNIPYTAVVDIDSSLGVALLEDGSEVSARRIDYSNRVAQTAVAATVSVMPPEIPRLA